MGRFIQAVLAIIGVVTIIGIAIGLTAPNSATKKNSPKSYPGFSLDDDSRVAVGVDKAKAVGDEFVQKAKQTQGPVTPKDDKKTIEAEVKSKVVVGDRFEIIRRSMPFAVFSSENEKITAMFGKSEMMDALTTARKILWAEKEDTIIVYEVSKAGKDGMSPVTLLIETGRHAGRTVYTYDFILETTAVFKKIDKK